MILSVCTEFQSTVYILYNTLLNMVLFNLFKQGHFKMGGGLLQKKSSLVHIIQITKIYEYIFLIIHFPFNPLSPRYYSVFILD